MSEMSKRKIVYDHLNEKFGFFENLEEMDVNSIKEKYNALCHFYQKELENYFLNEVLHF